MADPEIRRQEKEHEKTFDDVETGDPADTTQKFDMSTPAGGSPDRKEDRTSSGTTLANRAASTKSDDFGSGMPAMTRCFRTRVALSGRPTVRQMTEHHPEASGSDLRRSLQRFGAAT